MLPGSVSLSRLRCREADVSLRAGDGASGLAPDLRGGRAHAGPAHSGGVGGDRRASCRGGAGAPGGRGGERRV